MDGLQQIEQYFEGKGLLQDWVDARTKHDRAKMVNLLENYGLATDHAGRIADALLGIGKPILQVPDRLG